MSRDELTWRFIRQISKVNDACGTPLDFRQNRERNDNVLDRANLLNRGRRGVACPAPSRVARPDAVAPRTNGSQTSGQLRDAEQGLRSNDDAHLSRTDPFVLARRALERL
jgi:hypothetical protein